MDEGLIPLRPGSAGPLRDLTPLAADDPDQESAALGALARAFATLAGALQVEHGGPPMSSQQVIERAVECLPCIRHAALIAVHDGVVSTIAASPDLPDRIGQLRSTLGQGPALDALRTDELVLSNDLATDPRWPLFGRRLVNELGLRSVVSYRLYLGGRHHGALSFYSEWPYAFDGLAVSTGALFAAYCSLATLTGPHEPNPH